MQHEERTPVVFTRAHGFLLALSILMTAWWQFAHAGLLSAQFLHMPGIGLMLSQWIVFAVCVLLAAREKRLRLKAAPTGVLLGALSLLLTLCYGLYANDAMRLLNLPVLVFLTAQALLCLTGGAGTLSGSGLYNGAVHFVRSLFHNIPVPFRFLQERRGNETSSRRWSGFAVGIILSVPVLLIAVVLLTSADAVFHGIVTQGLNLFTGTNGSWLVKLFLTFVCGMLLFSLLYAYTQPPQEAVKLERRSARPMSFAVTLAALTAIYALFAYVQVRYLFGGAETAMLQGGYAEYARSGFFQLVAVAFFTLVVVLLALQLCPKSRVIRALCGAVSALTMVITFSAFFRMRLYISQFGLTLLRVLTLWGIAMIFLALLMAAAKCMRPALRLCPALCAVVLSGWVALNLCNIDLRIAQYNVQAANRGELSTLDADYLICLSPDVKPALEAIADDDLRAQVLAQASAHWHSVSPSAYDWSLSWRQENRR